MVELEHPLKAELLLVREIILGSDARIAEGIKWKAPSFFYIDWFATFNLRSADKVQVILHTGAKVKAAATEGLNIKDPDGLLKWLAKDRCMMTLGNASDIESKREAITSVVRQWLTHM